MVEKANLTEERVRSFAAPSQGERVLWDTKISGFGVRCFPSGRKVYIFMYRLAGAGRASPRRRMTLGEFGKVPLAAARSAAQKFAGDVAGGSDPQADRKAETKREASRLDRALEEYAKHLEQRHVVNRDATLRLLRRGMPGPAHHIDLASIDRQTLAAAIAKLEQKVRAPTRQKKTGGEKTVERHFGGPGAAADFRAKANTFFNWAVNRGLVYANPLAGWRRERATRAQITSRKGRALSADELKSVWLACDRVAAPYGDYVRLMVLTGQRRTETARMRWGDVSLEDPGNWRIPAHEAKNGRAHIVPLPPEAVALIKNQRRFVGNEFVFAGRTSGSAISNWSKRHKELTSEAGVEFTLHDLRRTFRSGLKALGVDTELAEMMLNHTREEIIETYDREPRLQERHRAARAWAAHVRDVASPKPPVENVLALDARRAAG